MAMIDFLLNGLIAFTLYQKIIISPFGFLG